MADTSKMGGVLVEFQPMSREEMRRTMQFLLAHQAQFAADFERLSTKVDGLADKVSGVTDAVARLTTVAGHTLAAVGDLVGTVERLGGNVDRVSGNLDRLSETVERLTDSERRADARLIELAEQGKATDARLGALIELFERHLRDDHPPRPS